MRVVSHPPTVYIIYGPIDKGTFGVDNLQARLQLVQEHSLWLLENVSMHCAQA